MSQLDNLKPITSFDQLSEESRFVIRIPESGKVLTLVLDSSSPTGSLVIGAKYDPDNVGQVVRCDMI
jgi:hypothetical protein